jgi:hypothetical protein
MNSIQSQRRHQRLMRRRRDCFATLVQRHASVRVLMHLTAMARKPRNVRWHLRCIGREFYDRS